MEQTLILIIRRRMAPRKSDTVNAMALQRRHGVDESALPMIQGCCSSCRSSRRSVGSFFSSCSTPRTAVKRRHKLDRMRL